MSTPTTAPQVFTSAITDGGDSLKDVLIVAVPAVIALGSFFWAGRLVLRKLGMGGKVAKI